jgi:PAS domain S-box-containing protein
VTAPPAVRPVAGRSAAADEDAPVTILLVDDRNENLMALEAILEPLGYRTLRAASGEEALRGLLGEDVAVILLDVQMPGMNGFETARMIKSRERTRYIPIVFLTAISKEEEYVFEGYAVGAVDYLFKPFHPEILRSKVAALVDLHLRQRRVTAQEQRLREVERQAMELKHMRELLQSDQRYRDIVRSAMDSIIAFDAGGTITLFNAAAERMFRCTAAKALGRPIAEFFPQASRRELERLRSAALGGRGASSSTGDADASRPAALRASRFTGEEFPVEASVSTPDGTGDVFTLIVRDISDRVRHEEALRQQAVSLARSTEELKQLNQELNRRQADLERAMTARNRFYASMSHELRTPINAVLGYSTLLLERIYGPLNDKQAEGIERTQRAARHLLELVNDVLDLSKIEAGKIDLRVQPVALNTLVDDLFVTVRPLADEHHSTLSVDGPADVSVATDPRRVRQILLNLLSNAIKFGAGKPIEVRIRATDGGGASISVTDHGPGIPTDDQERIFQEFVQLGKTQLQDGTGLGLSISRRLAELLNGSLAVQSESGAGSTFVLSLPAEIEPRARAFEVELPTETVDERSGSPDARPVRRPSTQSSAEDGSQTPFRDSVLEADSKVEVGGTAATGRVAGRDAPALGPDHERSGGS